MSGLIDRRRFLQGGCLLLVCASVSAPDRGFFSASSAAQLSNAVLAFPDPDAGRLDSWIAFDHDHKVRVFFGKVDVGQGLYTAIAQIVADQLDLPIDVIEVIAGDSALTPDQGGASSASGVEMGSRPLMNAAAEARRLILAAAAQLWAVPVETLTLQQGDVVSLRQSQLRSSVWDVLAQSAELSTDVTVSGSGNSLNIAVEAVPLALDMPASGAALKLVGQSLPRPDLSARIMAQYDGIDQIFLPGMLHGRVIRPAVAGAIPLSFDTGSLSAMGELAASVHIYQQGSWLALTAVSEWAAIEAARLLTVVWSDVTPTFPDASALYDWLQTAPARAVRTPVATGDAASVIASAPDRLEATYCWPFQSHACIAPACAVADVNGDAVTVWTASQKPHSVRHGVAALLQKHPQQVRAIHVAGPGSYGRNDADDAAMDAALLSLKSGKSVRVQYMRHDATAWDPKAPPAVMKVSAAWDDQGLVLAQHWHARAFSAHDVRPSGQDPADTLAGQQLGLTRDDVDNFSVPQDSYHFASRHLGWETIAPWLRMVSPLRTSHLRDPQGPQVTFASECFMDELAHKLALDPVQFRLQYLSHPRDIAAVNKVAELANWQTRMSPDPAQQARIRKGRGIAYCQRGRHTVVAIVCVVDVDTATGAIWPRQFFVAHDCGLVINPESLRQTIEGAVMQACSRCLYEEVQFTRSTVSSVDWLSYPILEATNAPEHIEIALLQDAGMPPLGAGEAAHKPVAAAIANAVFDATGVRLRTIPLQSAEARAAIMAVQT